MTSSTKKIAKDFERISTCYHEASHAIIALLFLCRVNSVNISENKYQFGEIQLNDASDLLFSCNSQVSDTIKLKVIKNYINMLYSGFVGETIYHRSICGSNKLPNYFKVGSFEDLQKITQTLNKFNLVKSGKDRVAFKKKIFKNMEKLLSENWEDVKLLVFHLYKYEKISFKKLKKLLCSKSNNYQFWITRFFQIETIYSLKEHISLSDIEQIFNSDTIFNSNN